MTPVSVHRLHPYDLPRRAIPVKLSPIRTDNAGQGFQGFWRPTA